jgi:hypothetical protein
MFLTKEPFAKRLACAPITLNASDLFPFLWKSVRLSTVEELVALRVEVMVELVVELEEVVFREVVTLSEVVTFSRVVKAEESTVETVVEVVVEFACMEVVLSSVVV